MKKIYTGPLRKMTIKKLEVNQDDVKILEYENTVVRKDALFYQFLGNYISFDYETRLASPEEAQDYILECLYERNNPDVQPYPTCLNVNPDEIRFNKSVSHKEFKQLKKSLYPKRSK